MEGNPKMFFDYKFFSSREKMFVADDSHVSIVGKESTLFNKYTVHYVLYVPDHR